MKITCDKCDVEYTINVREIKCPHNVLPGKQGHNCGWCKAWRLNI